MPIDPAIQSLVTAWMDAQNRRDFAAYQALHHPRFRGVRRDATGTKRFDRAGWLRDRASGFRTAPALAVHDVAVYMGAAHRQVLVAVRAGTGPRAADGTVAMVVADDRGALRILFEERLDGRPVAPRLASLPVAPGGTRDLWFGYDRAFGLQTMRVAPVVGGHALVAQTTMELPADGAIVTERGYDAAAGAIRAARVEAPLTAPALLAQVADQPVVVLDRGLAERCRGTLAAPTVRAAGTLGEPIAEVAAKDRTLVDATWKLGPRVIAAELRAPCRGAYVRGVAAAPIERELTHGQLPVGLLRTLGQDLAADALAWEVSAELGAERAGFALFSLTRAAGCTDPAHASRVLYTLARDRKGWHLARVAELAGAGTGMIVADVDGDGRLDAIVDGAAFVGGRADVWHAALAIPWPAGLACR